MRIQVEQMQNGDFILYIDEEQIMRHKQLSVVVNKIEQYLKMRFLAEPEKGVIEKLKGRVFGE